MNKVSIERQSSSRLRFSFVSALLPLALSLVNCSTPVTAEPSKPATKPATAATKPQTTAAAEKTGGKPGDASSRTSSKAQSKPADKPIKAGPMVKGDVLKQVSDWRGGMKMELCKLGARWVTGNVVVLMLPDKRAYFINHATKTFAPVNKKTWTKSLGFATTDNGPEKVKRLPDENFMGAKANHFEVTKYIEGKNFLADYNNPQAKGKKTTPAPKHYYFRYRQHLWASNDFPVSKDFLSECAAVCMMPGGYGLPLRVMRVEDEKTSFKDKKFWKVYLDTLKIERSVMLDSNNFKLPTKDQGYKQVKSELEVMMGEEDPLKGF